MPLKSTNPSILIFSLDIFGHVIKCSDVVYLNHLIMLQILQKNVLAL